MDERMGPANVFQVGLSYLEENIPADYKIVRSNGGEFGIRAESDRVVAPGAAGGCRLADLTATQEFGSVVGSPRGAVNPCRSPYC
jgi:hypothetical protein